MSDDSDNARTAEQLGCVCPMCNAVFRVGAEAAGSQVACPGCGLRVQIPAEEELVPPPPSAESPAVTVEYASFPPSEDRTDTSRTFVTAEDGSHLIRKKHIKRKTKMKAESEVLSWEANMADAGVPSFRGRPVMAILLVLGTIALAGGFVVLLQNVFGPERVPSQGASPGRGAGAVPEAAPEVSPFENIETRKILIGIEEAIWRFAEAGNVDAMLKTIRGGKSVEERVRAYYQRHPFEKPRIKKIAPAGIISSAGDLWSVDVIMHNFESRAIALESSDDEYKVDWESWVGYSEMDWTEFIDTRPVESKVFRVICSPVEYYNFDFSDDRKWRSFRLGLDRHDEVLFGYVPVFSTMASRLTPLLDSNKESAFVMRLRFPEGGKGHDQVLIEEVVKSGWVMPPDWNIPAREDEAPKGEE